MSTLTNPDEKAESKHNGLQIHLYEIDNSDQNGQIISQTPQVVWQMNEAIFKNGLFLANMHTGSARSPIDANEFVSIKSHNLKTAPAFPVNSDKDYHLSITSWNNPTLFGAPELCYFSMNLISNPLVGLNEFNNVLGQVVHTHPEVTIAPNGAAYIKPKQGKLDTIHIPSFKSILKKLQSSQAGQIEHILPHGKFTVNYDFMFCVRPTLYGIYKYFQGAWQGFQNLFAASKDDPSLLPMIWERNNNSNQITVPDLDHFHTFLNKTGIPIKFLEFLLKEAFLSPNKEQSREIAKILLSMDWLSAHNMQQDIKKILGKLGGKIDNWLDGESDDYLEKWVVNIPVCFKVDPMARVTNNNTNPDDEDWV